MAYPGQQWDTEIFVSWDTLEQNYEVYMDLVQSWLRSGDAEDTSVNGVDGVYIYLTSTTDTDGNGYIDFLETNASGGFTPTQGHAGG